MIGLRIPSLREELLTYGVDTRGLRETTAASDKKGGDNVIGLDRRKKYRPEPTATPIEDELLPAPPAKPPSEKFTFEVIQPPKPDDVG